MTNKKSMPSITHYNSDDSLDELPNAQRSFIKERDEDDDKPLVRFI